MPPFLGTGPRGQEAAGLAVSHCTRADDRPGSRPFNQNYVGVFPSWKGYRNLALYGLSTAFSGIGYDIYCVYILQGGYRRHHHGIRCRHTRYGRPGVIAARPRHEFDVMHAAEAQNAVLGPSHRIGGALSQRNPSRRRASGTFEVAPVHSGGSATQSPSTCGAL